jgi:sec-independent protein translocase protein TatA
MSPACDVLDVPEAGDVCRRQATHTDARGSDVLRAHPRRRTPVTGGPMEIGLIIFAILVLFGYKKLPDASRSLGRSLRIFKGEMRGLKEDDRTTGTTQPHEGDVLPPRGEIGPSHPDAGIPESQADARRTGLRPAHAEGPVGRSRPTETAEPVGGVGERGSFPAGSAGGAVLSDR